MIEIEVTKVILGINILMIIIAVICYTLASSSKTYRRNGLLGIVMGISVVGITTLLIGRVTPVEVFNERYIDKKVLRAEEKSGIAAKNYIVEYEDGTIEKMIGTIDNSALTDKENKYEYRVKLVKYYKDIGTVRVVNERKRLVLEKVVDSEKEENKNN